MASQDYNEEDWEALSDVETALDNIGIKLRENANTYRDTETILDEIAEKWDTLDETSQNSVVSALAGTRQREIVLTLFENWDSVENFARISADSYGTAEEKMLAFTDSIEAAQNRVTDAVDQWALWANGAEAMKYFYNILAYVIRNLDTFGITIGLLVGALNAKNIANLIGSGIGGLGSKVIGINNKLSNFASNASLKGVGTSIKDTIFSTMENSYIESVQEKYTNQLIKNTQTLSKEDQARAVNLAKTLMEADERESAVYNLATQNEVMARNAFQSDKYGLVLKQANGTVMELLTVEERRKLLETLMAETDDEAIKQRLKNIAASKDQQLSEKELEFITEQLANARQSQVNQQATGIAGQYRGEMKTSGGAKTAMLTGAATIGTGILTGLTGSNIGSAFGEDGQIIGTMLGGTLGEFAAPAMAKALAKGATALASKGIFKGLSTAIGTALGGPIGGLIVSGVLAVVTTLPSIISYWTEKAVEEAANKFQEESDRFSEMTNSLNNVTNFDKYVKGVDSLGRNVSLTEEEYQKWLEASNALAEVFPELTMYTDDQGNKIVGLNGKVTELTDTINEYIDAQQRATDQALLEPDLLNANYEDAKEQYDEAKKQLDLYESIQKNLKEARASYYNQNSKTASYRTSANANQIQDMVNAINAAGVEGVRAWIDPNTTQQFEVQGTIDQINEAFDKVDQSITNNISTLTSDVKAATSLMSDEISSIFREMENQAQYSTFFDNLSKDELTKIKAVVNDSITLDASDGEAFRKEVEDLFASIAQDVQDNPAILDLYVEASSAETGSDYRALREQLKNSIITAWGDDFATWSEARKAFIVELGFEITEEGLVDTTDTLQKIRDLVGGDVAFSTNWFDSLDLEEQNRIFEMFRNNVADATTETQTLANLLYADRETTGLDDTMTKLTEQMEIFAGLGPRIQEFYDNYSGTSEDLAKSVADAFSDVPEEIRNKIEDGYDEFQEAGEGAGTEFVAGMMEEIYDSNLTNQYEEYLTELAQFAFPDLEFDGYIDSISELGSAMESVTGQFDKIKAAFEEQNAVGKLSWQTIFDLISANTQYVNALEFTANGIKLKNNAEEIMLGIQRSAIQANIEAAISEIENRNEILNTAIQKLKQGQDVATVANSVADSSNIEIAAIDKTTNAWIKAGKAAAAYNSAAAGDMSWDEYNSIVGSIGQSNVSSARASRGSGFSGTGASTGSSGGSFSSGARGGGFSSLKEHNVQAWAETLTVDDITSISADDFLTYGYAATDSEARQLIDQYQTEIDTNLNQITLYREFLSHLGDDLTNWYTTPDYDSGSSSGSGADDEIESAKKYLETLQQLQSLINKEWEDMLAFKNNTDSAYYGKMRENLTAQLEEVNRLLENFDEYLAAGMLEESDYNDLMQQRIDLQVEINNLDDEQVQEAIDLLETQDASIVSLIEAQKQLIATSDTYEELVERQQELNDLLEQQRELQRDVYEFERNMAEMATEYVSGTAYSNSRIYEAMMSLQKQSVEQQMESLLDSYNTVIAQKMQQYSSEGLSAGEAYNMAYDSEEARDLIQQYWELFQEYGDLVYQEFEDKVNELDQMIEDVESTKSEKWASLKDIAPYYETLVGYIELKLGQIEKALADTSNMTDEQIQDWVDQYNDAIQQLRQAQEDQLQDTIDYQEETFSALTSWVQEQIDALQDLQNTIDDEYQPLIDDINDYNDAVDRTNELLELQQNLKDSLSSKERVYREGIGWVYYMPMINYIG